MFLYILFFFFHKEYIITEENLRKLKKYVCQQMQWESFEVVKNYEIE